MYKDWSYKEVEAKATAIKELGFDEIYLNKGTMPWHLATHCSAGGSHRLDISTSVWFYGISPSDISLRWSSEIEPHNASGKATYQIDLVNCRKVLSKLSSPCREQFQHYLMDCSRAVKKQVEELLTVANNELKVADALAAASSIGIGAGTTGDTL